MSSLLKSNSTAAEKMTNNFVNIRICEKQRDMTSTNIDHNEEKSPGGDTDPKLRNELSSNKIFHFYSSFNVSD